MSLDKYKSIGLSEGFGSSAMVFIMGENWEGSKYQE